MSSLLELLKQKKQDLAAGRRKKTAKLVDGRNRIRIAPSWRGAGQQFWHDFSQHFVKNAAGELQAIYVCTDKTFGRPCGVCDAIQTGIKSATDDATMELLKEAKSSARILVNAVNRAPKAGAPVDEVEIYELPPTVFASILEIAQEWEEAGESIFDLDGGKDLIISREGTGKNTKYTVTPAAKSAPLPKEVLSKLHNLDEYVQQESAEQQLKALNSVRSIAGLLPAPKGAAPAGIPLAARAGAEVIEDDDTPAVPPSKRTAPAPAPKAVDATDVDFEDIPDSVTAPAAPAAPAPKPAPAPAPAVAASDSTGDADLDDLLKSLG